MKLLQSTDSIVGQGCKAPSTWSCKRKDKFRLLGLGSVLTVLCLILSLTIVKIYYVCPRLKGCKYVVYDCQPWLQGSELCSFYITVEQVEHCKTGQCSGIFCKSTCLQNNPWTDGTCPRNGSKCSFDGTNDEDYKYYELGSCKEFSQSCVGILEFTILVFCGIGILILLLLLMCKDMYKLFSRCCACCIRRRSTVEDDQKQSLLSDT